MLSKQGSENMKWEGMKGKAEIDKWRAGGSETMRVKRYCLIKAVKGQCERDIV